MEAGPLLKHSSVGFRLVIRSGLSLTEESGHISSGVCGVNEPRIAGHQNFFDNRQLRAAARYGGENLRWAGGASAFLGDGLSLGSSDSC